MYNNKIIFLVFRDEFPATNEWSHKAVIETLNSQGIKTIEVLGVYMGSSEKSIMVDLSDYNMDLIKTIAKLYNQESILVSKGNALLLFLNGSGSVTLGSLIEVSESEAKSNDSYTYIPSTNKYILAK